MREWSASVAVLVVIILAMLLPVGLVSAAPPARDCGGASVYINSPQADETVGGPVAISGSAALPPGEFRYYKVEFSSAGQNAWVTIVDGVRTPVLNGTLATVNADTLPPGDYSLRVRVVDRTANYCEAFVSPIHIGAGPSDSPTPVDSPTAVDTPTPVGTPFGHSTPQTEQLSVSVAPTVAGTPTLNLQIPTVQPGSDALMTSGRGISNSLPTLPVAELSSLGTSAMDWAGTLGRSFIFGIQLTAAVFTLLGVIVFLRRNL